MRAIGAGGRTHRLRPPPGARGPGRPLPAIGLRQGWMQLLVPARGRDRGMRAARSRPHRPYFARARGAKYARYARYAKYERPVGRVPPLGGSPAGRGDWRRGQGRRSRRRNAIDQRWRPDSPVRSSVGPARIWPCGAIAWASARVDAATGVCQGPRSTTPCTPIPPGAIILVRRASCQVCQVCQVWEAHGTSAASGRIPRRPGRLAPGTRSRRHRPGLDLMGPKSR